MEALIVSGLSRMGLSVPGERAGRLARYGELLLEQNRVMNLTAITDPAEVATLHMLDCAALLNCLPLAGKRLLDVGTGAGFPGLVLKTLEPTLELTLLDSLQKRLDWLAQVARELELTGVHICPGRAEEEGHRPQLRECFQVVTARAVAELRILCELTLPFVAVGGHLLAMKSVRPRELEEAQGAMTVLGGRLADCRDYTIPHTDVTHRVVVVEKVSPTPPTYPRRWARVQKSPL